MAENGKDNRTVDENGNDSENSTSKNENESDNTTAVMGDRDLYTREWGADVVWKMRRMLKRYLVITPRCHVWTGPICQRYGDMRLCVFGRRPHFRMHRVVFRLNHPRVCLAADMHVSHLCHNPLCGNPAHLSYETAAMNNSRKCCRSDGECYGHFRRPDCLYLI